MNFLHRIPFLRILLPFLAGIGFWLITKQDAPGLFVVGFVYAVCMLLYFLLIRNSKEPGKVLFGLMMSIFLFFSGWTLCKFSDERQNPDNYSCFLKDSVACYAGYVSEIPVEKTKRVKAEITLQQVKLKGTWLHTSGKIIAYFEKTDKTKRLETGNTIVFKGQLQAIQGALNPHAFDYKAYLSLRNIFHSVYLKQGHWEVAQQTNAVSIFGFTQKIRKQLLDAYRQSGLQDTEFAMVAALVLGYDDEIDKPLLNAYSHTGTLHVLSVSGLHVGIIYLLLGYMLSFLDRSKRTGRIKVVLIIGFLWFFVLLSGFSSAAVRAAFMFSLIALGKTFYEEVETANIVLVSAFFSLCINPFWLGDIGFQLSYIAVLGIIYLYPYFFNLFSFSWGVAEKIWALCSVSIAAQLATLPVTLYYFHQFPSLFLLSNLIMIPISTLVMYGGILVLVFFKIGFVAHALVWATSFLIKAMNACALFFDGLPFCVIDHIHLSVINLLLFYVLLLLLFISIEQKSYKLLMSSFGIAIVMLVISIGFDVKTKEQKELVIYQSDKINTLSVLSGNTWMLFSDTIPDERLEGALREYKIYNDVVLEKRAALSTTCLIVAHHKRVLFVKDVDLLSEKFIRVVKPDYIWIPGRSLRRVKIPEFLCGQKNLIVSGKFYNRKAFNCVPEMYATYERGAFCVGGD
jgi:competence protein ComEC